MLASRPPWASRPGEQRGGAGRGGGGAQRAGARRLIDRDSAEGAEELALGAAAMTPFQLEAVWRREYDRWFRRLVLLFSAGIPLSLAVFTPLALIKLPRCPACAWAVGCSSITGLAVWLRFHLSMVSHILWASEVPGPPNPPCSA